MSRRIVFGVVIAALGGAALGILAVLNGTSAGLASPPASEADPPAEGDAKEPAWAPAVEPKPLSEQVRKGLAWLAEHQLSSGAWGQGEEAQRMGGGEALRDTPSVADTCIAALAMIRAGNTPEKGDFRDAVRKAVEYVCSEVEKSDKDSIYVTETRGTRAQGKLGPYIDTFMASMLLAEVQDRMPDEAGKKRVADALDKVVAKIQKNQRKDGTWSDQGWAAALSQGIAVKGLNRAAQAGREVSDLALERAADYAASQFDRPSGSFSKEGSAGVELYSAGANLSSLAESNNTNVQTEPELRERAQTAASPAARAEAAGKLARIESTRRDLDDARQAVIRRLDDKAFIAGFGSNGGEEFLSYMNIGESLVVQGGNDWKTWDTSITENLNRIQNKDGSWTGHHCITGRTFCTAAALLVLMVDRAPVPVAAQMGRR